MLQRLEADGVAVTPAIRDGRLLVKDAAETLDRISLRGEPHPRRFHDAVGLPVMVHARSARLRAYGEMVDILAGRGDFAEAITLERLWNGLAERVDLSLMCGYSAAHFVSPNTHRALRDICGAHDHVCRSLDDPLASWLLTSAHNSLATTGATSSILH